MVSLHKSSTPGLPGEKQEIPVLQAGPRHDEISTPVGKEPTARSSALGERGISSLQAGEQQQLRQLCTAPGPSSAKGWLLPFFPAAEPAGTGTAEAVAKKRGNLLVNHNSKQSEKPSAASRKWHRLATRVSLFTAKITRLQWQDAHGQTLRENDEMARAAIHPSSLQCRSEQ